MGKIIMS